MTIDESYNFVNFICNKEQQGQITPQNYNVIAPIAQMSVINKRLDGIRNPKAFRLAPDIHQRLTEDLRTIFTSVDTTPGGGTRVNNVTYPADALYIHSVNTNIDPSSINELRIVTIDEYTKLERNQVKAASLEYPLAIINGDVINIRPIETFISIKTYYYKKPPNPVWNYTEVNDRAVYAESGGIIGDGNSVDFTLNELLHLEICTKILQMAGCNLNLDRVLDYAMTEEAKGS
jgi:hypothetical protein